mmetsp:Transcript_2266/g.4662  ORF Transcript_2266/g.4662 Transcript_2266/m.4662 type:complete len:172 (-) Transcript_2266:931-1446(-)
MGQSAEEKARRCAEAAGPYPKPRGRVPRGTNGAPKIWDKHQGGWHEDNRPLPMSTWPLPTDQSSTATATTTLPAARVIIETSPSSEDVRSEQVHAYQSATDRATADCGSCVNCLDKVKFGGSGRTRHGCVNRAERKIHVHGTADRTRLALSPRPHTCLPQCTHNDTTPTPH